MQRDSCLELCFFFYSVTDVISNVAKYNTSVKIYLSKSKITDFKNYLKITKYTKKLFNYSNVSKSNSLLYTSAYMRSQSQVSLPLHEIPKSGVPRSYALLLLSDYACRS